MSSLPTEGTHGDQKFTAFTMLLLLQSLVDSSMTKYPLFLMKFDSIWLHGTFSRRSILRKDTVNFVGDLHMDMWSLLWLALNWYFVKSSVSITGLFEKINDGPMTVSPSSISNGSIRMVTYNVFFSILMALIRNIESLIIVNHGTSWRPF